MSKIKILIISDLTGGLGGVYTYLQQIQSCMPKGIEVHVLLDSSTQENVSANYFFMNIKYAPLSTKIYSESQIVDSLKNEIVNLSPNLIHVVNGSIRSNLVIREFLSSVNTPFIVTEQYVDESLILNDHSLSRIKKVNQASKHVIYVSNKNVEIAANVFNIKPRYFSVIFNGIIPLKKKKDKYSKSPFRFLTTGRCVPQKGIDTIINAISLIQNFNIEFHLIGDGEHRNEYMSLAQKVLKPNHKFVINGWSKQIEYDLLIDDFDLYISASRQEGLSYSLLEAATAGFPILCSDCSGNIELAQLCKRGYLFAKDNYHQLSDLIIEFISNPIKLNYLAQHNTYLVDNMFNLKAKMSELKQIYLTLKN